MRLLMPFKNETSLKHFLYAFSVLAAVHMRTGVARDILCGKETSPGRKHESIQNRVQGIATESRLISFKKYCTARLSHGERPSLVRSLVGSQCHVLCPPQ
ncbi:hypothetical protein KIL84_004183 [Mauremys mutica]|uniref:Uncharacterized protein n=1 Tax=Mauremys mutica TaxID=74926 RepID=A0A9D3XNG6_9SAUR|nr:hypothetical protein KIL84_004183 [Mauremys mutica]